MWSTCGQICGERCGENQPAATRTLAPRERRSGARGKGSEETGTVKGVGGMGKEMRGPRETEGAVAARWEAKNAVVRSDEIPAIRFESDFCARRTDARIDDRHEDRRFGEIA